jgi:hypothetical protein
MTFTTVLEITLYSLLYVSRALLRPADVHTAIAAILEVSLARNAVQEVTGALLYTGERFAQLLEGPEGAVLGVMDSIRRDPRHTDIVSLEPNQLTARRFASWSLAYSGHSTFAAGIVERALEDRSNGHGEATARLIRLMRELVHARGGWAEPSEG